MCYRSVIHLNYPVDVSGDNTNAGGKEFVASCFPLRSGKEEGRRDLFHIVIVNVLISMNACDEYHEIISVTVAKTGMQEKRKM